MANICFKKPLCHILNSLQAEKWICDIILTIKESVYVVQKEILLVDDDSDFTSLIKRVAENDGYFVEGVASVKEAMLLLKKRSYSAYIIDAELEEGNGLDFYRWLMRQQPEQTRFAFVSNSYRHPKDYTYLKNELHFDLVLNKPLELSAVHSMFRVLLEEPQLTEDELLLQDISQNFKDSAPAKIERLNDLCEEYTRTGEGEALEEFRRIIHRLAGTASSFGLGRVSEICRKLDMRIADLLEKEQLHFIEADELKGFIAELMVCFQFPNWSRFEGSIEGEVPNLDLVLVSQDFILSQRFQKLALNHHFQFAEASSFQELKRLQNRFAKGKTLIVQDGALLVEGNSQAFNGSEQNEEWKEEWKEESRENGQIFENVAMQHNSLIVLHEEREELRILPLLERTQTGILSYECNLRYLTWFVYQNFYGNLLGSQRIWVWGRESTMNRLKNYLNEGIQVETEWGAVKEAWQIVENLSPLVATLVLMVDQGEESLKKIRELRLDERSASVKVIVVGRSKKRAALAYSCGANAYLEVSDKVALQHLLSHQLKLEKAQLMRLNKQGTNGVLSFGGFLQRGLETFSRVIRQNDALTLVRVGIRQLHSVRERMDTVAFCRWNQNLGMEIAAQLRLSDIVSIRREGEFVILLEGANKKDSHPLIERILGDLNLKFNKKESPLDLGAGIVSFPEDGTSLHQLLKRSEEVYERALKGREGNVIKWSEVHRDLIHKERGILIVEPEEELGSMLEFALKARGWPVTRLRNGEEFIEALKKGYKPILVLSERMLPEGDGIDLFQRANRLYELPLKWIFISSKSTTEDVIAGLKVGARDYITKPFNLEILLAKIKSHLVS